MDSVFVCLCWWIAKVTVAGSTSCVWTPLLWWHGLAVLISWVATGFSRLGNIERSRKAFNGGRYWWMGEGVWIGEYSDVSEVLKNNQLRRTYATAPTPDLYPTGGLIFLSNDGPDSEWAAIRRALHTVFLDTSGSELQDRLAKLKSVIANAWPNPKLADTADTAFLHKLAAKSIFFLLTGIVADETDTALMAEWPGVLAYLLFPRFMHRVIFNVARKKVQQLRIDTVKLFEKHHMQHLFIRMNSMLPEKYRRKETVRLCEEITFVFGFAGVGGTSTALASVASFLRAKAPLYSAMINFGQYSTEEAMAAAYRADPDSYIKEALRMDPPVNAAFACFDKDTTIPLFGGDFVAPTGILKQYSMSLANRQESVFPNSGTFDPTRANLNEALTFNGAFGTPNEETVYPRICPGRHIALAVQRAIWDHVMQVPS